MESEESLHLLHPEQGKNLGFSAVEFLSLILLAACQSPMNGFISCFSNDERKDKRWPAVHLLKCQFSFMLIIRLVLHTVNGLHHFFCAISRRVLQISFSIHLILPTKTILPLFPL